MCRLEETEIEYKEKMADSTWNVACIWNCCSYIMADQG